MNPQVGAAIVQGAGQVAGGMLASHSNKKVAKQQWRRTKVLNQNQIQWRVADAKKAGIHPLAALGMSPIGNAAPATGSVMGDAVAGVADAAAQGIRGAAQAKSQSVLDQAALAESGARTEAALSEAQRNRAEADWLDQQRTNSIVGLFKSPGRADTNALTSPGISPKHLEMYQDVDPRAAPGGANASIRTPLGTFDINPDWTPTELVEQTRGELAGEIFGLLGLAGDTVRNFKMSPSKRTAETMGSIIHNMPINWILELARLAGKDPVVQWKKGPTPSGKMFNIRRTDK